ncbi:transcription factor Jun-like [Crassostrea virginica]|uniref:Transcription factor AP-1-like n=1 Tax=Crassostrea virginica TaxID=6565 RepID=A0A8B8CN06_CRAVI|nr:transcription factor AP-1-like [Crassostrea virginica]|eukprot:CAMPEP_0203747046 /NCGR_PEP_ID=MMETSP0098-20131031/2306_1 /ASSEMBLY_ACC=CAM_ASM_000208 /TAXON_ID=96639 /ORGANISM=" , Strain NY0313808BC1" /LENGTH=287 /DNA_ID=CAMNT_0050635347 /DNA_START=56 /DNA_END=919 /DNA_ORIENTATION=+
MEAIDRTFYHDDGHGLKLENNQVNQLKRKMTLDFNSGSKTKQQKVTNLLASPDLNMLKLASPELEKMIIQANGMVTTTPTPTQFIFPKHVTEEQEQYARGFVEALAELHQIKPSSSLAQSLPPQSVKVESDSEDDDDDSQSSYSNNEGILSLTTTTSLPGGLSSANIPRIATNFSQLSSRIDDIKEEPQTVPCVGSPPLSPINMDNQEKIKLERKRARNRIAARKCRTRKLERIARLEERVAELKGQNNQLANSATSLRDQVCKLKRQIIEHVNSGCSIMISSSLQL